MAGEHEPASAGAFKHRHASSVAELQSILTQNRAWADAMVQRDPQFFKKLVRRRRGEAKLCPLVAQAPCAGAPAPRTWRCSWQTSSALPCSKVSTQTPQWFWVGCADSRVPVSAAHQHIWWGGMSM